MRFNFITESLFQDINNIISQKENFLFFLKEEVATQKLMDHLKDDSFKVKVSNYQQDLASEICADVPNAF